MKPAIPVALLLLLLPGGRQAGAQEVSWTTNYYSVTGASFREIRRSIAAARPWKDPFDGLTHWTVRWRFGLRDGPKGCSLNTLNTTVTIVTTMPRWTPPAEAGPELKAQWSRFFVKLARHEAGHARFAIAAAEEIRRRLPEIPPAGSCDELRDAANRRAEAVLEETRRRERDYDRRTDHGAR